MGKISLGINIGHDQGAAIVKDGKLLGALSQERIDRIKHSASIRPPFVAIDALLRYTQIKITDIDCVGFSSTAVHIDDLQTYICDALKEYYSLSNINILSVSHHQAHAESAYFTSDFSEAIVLVADGGGDPELTWETSKKFDVGFDFTIFNRATFTFDFYNDDTDDALYKVPLSYTTGLSSTYKNIGKMRNTGIEFGANSAVYSNNDVIVNVFANITWNKNKVIKLADGSIEGTYSIIEEGRPYRQFYMPEYAGVNPENGKAQYYLNEEGDELTENLAAFSSTKYLG